MDDSSNYISPHATFGPVTQNDHCSLPSLGQSSLSLQQQEGFFMSYIDLSGDHGSTYVYCMLSTINGKVDITDKYRDYGLVLVMKVFCKLTTGEATPCYLTTTKTYY